jgi:hypothetical protein
MQYILKKSFKQFSLPPCAAFLIYPDKILCTPVVCFFNVIRKITGWQFAHASVIVQAITANAFPAAWIRTIAMVCVLVFLAIHDNGFIISDYG